MEKWAFKRLPHWSTSHRGYTVKICSNKRQKKLNKFIQEVISGLFGKNTCLINEKNTNRAYIKFSSKFIYYFIFDYVKIVGNKTRTVRLKNDIETYSTEFLKGVLLGLSLSDGHLDKSICLMLFQKNCLNRTLE